MENDLRRELEAAERKNNDNYERETARRLGEEAWRSLSIGIEAPSMGQKSEALDAQHGEADKKAGTEKQNDQERADGKVGAEKQDLLSLDWFLEKPEGTSQDAPEEIEEIGKREQQAILAMREVIGANLVAAARENSELSKREAELNLLLRMAEQVGRDRVSTRSEVTDYIRGQINSVKEGREKLAEQTPESYTLVHGLELREHIAQVRSGEMVTTPYVKEHLERVEDNIAKGRPTFLHGHLGSGKTELAINAARRASINKAAYEEAEERIKEYHKEHPNASKEDHAVEFGRAYRKSLGMFEREFKEGNPGAHERFNPLVISGSKDLTTSDLFADKTLKLTKFNGKPLLEHKKDLDDLISQWKEDHPDEASDPEKCKEEADKILELYKLKNQAFGTEVETIKQAIYRGVEEGRPVIIDEINAIPAAVLISLNDVLQRRPGDNCYIPGVGATKIQPGFAIIMTGNLSSSGVNYLGTEGLNPAFLSRLDVIEHGYLPMQENCNLESQDDPRKSELFHVVVSYLADRQGNLRLPEMDKSLEKLFSLCQLARATQDIFSGKLTGSIGTESGDEIEARLEKSVLSIRNVLNVLEEWDKGSDKDLDKALFDGFIAGVTNADDQNLILVLAQKYNFFSRADGYNVESRPIGAGFTTWEEIHPGRYNFNASPLETKSVRKVVELLYGPGPEREVYPETINLDEAESEAHEELTDEDVEKYQKMKGEIGEMISALRVLGEQCGCEVKHDDQGE